MTTTRTPLQQRLHLYRFALVHLDPERPFDPKAFGTPAPQYLHAGPRAWRDIFANYPEYNPLGESAVVCASIKQLIRVRAQQPARQLILVRTPFAPMPKKSDLRALARSLPLNLLSLEPLLAEDDDIQPLYYQRTMPEPPFDGEARIVSAHPYRAWFEQLQKERPESKLIVQEDGLTCEQPSLFTLPTETDDTASQKERERYDSWFLENFARVQGRAYIFAKDRELLSWFKADCVRLLGPRFFCWDYPTIPDPRDPLNHFVLVHDGAIRFRMLEHPFPYFHLDGDDLESRYRMARYPIGGAAARWRSFTAPNARADFQTENRLLVFHRENDQWHSYRETLGPNDLPMESDDFTERRKALDLLLGDPRE